MGLWKVEGLWEGFNHVCVEENKKLVARFVF